MFPTMPEVRRPAEGKPRLNLAAIVCVDIALWGVIATGLSLVT